MFSCGECSTEPHTFSSVDELEIHLACEHFNFFPYECEKCRFAKFPTEFALVSHYQNDHGVKDFYIRYRYTPENRQKQLSIRRKLTELCENRVNITAMNSESGPSTQRSASLEKNEEENDSYPSSVDLLPHPIPRPIHSPQTTNLLANMNRQEMAAALSVQDNFQMFHHDAKAQASTSSHTSVVNINNRSSDLSPQDFAPEAFAPGGLDYAAIMGEADDLIRRPRDLVTCQVCGLQVSNQRSSLVYHANTKHIKLNLYQCAVCQKTWQTIAKSDVLKHVKAIHNGDETMIIDNRKRLGFQLRVFVAKCFPPKQTQRGRPSQGTSYNNPSLPGSGAPSSISTKEDGITHELVKQEAEHEGTYEELDDEDGL